MKRWSGFVRYIKGTSPESVHRQCLLKICGTLRSLVWLLLSVNVKDLPQIDIWLEIMALRASPEEILSMEGPKQVTWNMMFISHWVLQNYPQTTLHSYYHSAASCWVSNPRRIWKRVEQFCDRELVFPCGSEIWMNWMNEWIGFI